METSSENSNASGAGKRRRAQRTLAVAGAALAGGVLALAVVLGWLAWNNRDGTPKLTGEAFASAEALWQQAGPADYDVAIAVEGMQPALYEVEVRGGQAVSARRNGAPLPQRRTWSTWSVPGMFGTLTADLRQIEAQQSRFGKSDLEVRARFDARYGYPATYRRIEWGTGQQARWEVTRFEVK